MTNATNIKINGLNLIDGKPWPNGDKLIALFDCEANGFQLRGCPLIRTARGVFTVQAPRGENQRSVNERAIRIIDPHLRDQLMNAALQAYGAFGGEVGQKGQVLDNIALEAWKNLASAPKRASE